MSISLICVRSLLQGALGWKNLKILDVAGNRLSVFPVGVSYLDKLPAISAVFVIYNIFSMFNILMMFFSLMFSFSFSHWRNCFLKETV